MDHRANPDVDRGSTTTDQNETLPRRLAELGWDPFFEQHFQTHREAGLIPARIATESRGRYRVLDAARSHDHHGADELPAELTGKLRYLAEDSTDLPAVGDWVAAQRLPGAGGEMAIIHAVLPRRGRLVRQAAGGGGAQLLAVNVDSLFIVTSCNHKRSPRRLERYLALAHQGGVAPVVVLTKADLTSEAEVRDAAAELATVADGAPVYPVSALPDGWMGGDGLEALLPHLGVGRTVALVGSSGVGKSTLVNRLAGDRAEGDPLATAAVRAGDDKGRHTTTRRQLIRLPGDGSGTPPAGAAGLLIDTPGLRELALWAAGDDGTGDQLGFDDIARLADECRFRDCGHRDEPGCAVLAAVAAGRLDEGRLTGYRKLHRELRYQADRQEAGAAAAERRKYKIMMGEVLSKQGKLGKHRRT